MGYMRHMRYMECEGSQNRDVQFCTTHLDESMEHDYSWCLTKVTTEGEVTLHTRLASAYTD